MKNNFYNSVIAVILLLSTISCKEAKNDKAYIDEAFNSLYMRDSDGVTGADGTISILLDDGSSLFMTGDCFFGEIENDKRVSGKTMINTALIHIDEDYNYISSYYNGSYDDPKSLFKPLESDTAKNHFWYWPGHGFQQGEVLHLFMTKFDQASEGQWGFRFRGTDYLRVDANDYTVLSTEEIYPPSAATHWGHSVIKDSDYVYIYGTRADKSIFGMAYLYVSRAKVEKTSNRLSEMEYYTSEGWQKEPQKSMALESINKSVSEQFSVFKHNEKYVLVTQERGQQAGAIYSYTSATPYGPWENESLLYTTKEQDSCKNLFTYNTMAHPQFINKDNELLICYNVNSYELEDIHNDVFAYRPVFLRVPMEMILNPSVEN